MNLEWIASKYLIDCHVLGVDSIMFDDTPGKRVRAFIANSHHELWRNDPDGCREFSVALHPHHCPVKLVKIFGTSVNVLAASDAAAEYFKAWIYQSQMTTGEGSFVYAGF